jgi:uncharacterized protein (TIGR00299 family) protein
MNHTLYLSCYSGISGNMFVGALLDAGLEQKTLREMIEALPLSGYELTIKPVVKHGITSTFFDVRLDPQAHQPHRHLADIVEIIRSADLNPSVQERSIAVFTKLAEAEAKVHGTTIEKIHFHEVGAVDAIIDVVATVFGLDQLGIDSVYAGNLRTGFGFIDCAHGSMPIPAPATAELLHGIPYTQGSIEKELITPTGAALLATLCEGFGDLPEGFVAEKTAYGAGGWDLDIPNVLRAQVGSMTAASTDQLLVLETNIDDGNPQLFDHTMERLFKAGALDVWQTPILMKKNRFASKWSVLCPITLQNELETILFKETTTIGIRSTPVSRTVAERRDETVQTPWGTVRVKISSHRGKVCSVTPEYDDCRAVSEAAGIPLKKVIQTARNAVSATE